MAGYGKAGRAMHGMARHDMSWDVRQGWHIMALRQGMAWKGVAWHGMEGRAWPVKAWHGMAGNAWHGSDGPGRHVMAWYGVAWQQGLASHGRMFIACHGRQGMA